MRERLALFLWSYFSIIVWANESAELNIFLPPNITAMHCRQNIRLFHLCPHYSCLLRRNIFMSEKEENLGNNKELYFRPFCEFGLVLVPDEKCFFLRGLSWILDLKIHFEECLRSLCQWKGRDEGLEGDLGNMKLTFTRKYPLFRVYPSCNTWFTQLAIISPAMVWLGL